MYSRRGTDLLNFLKRGYQRMTTEEYLLNTRESLTNVTMQKAKLRPLLEASKRHFNSYQKFRPHI